MTREEAVNWLINIMSDIGKSQHRDLWHYEQALAEIKKMLEEEPQWVPCSETVDIPEREVLCCDRYGAELIGWLSYSDDQWLCESDGATMYDPIAWCEKPESQWIPCSITTNLPDHEVLCCDIRGNMLIGYLYTDENSDTGFGAESDDECLVDCVAWREKPEPWKEGE